VGALRDGVVPSSTPGGYGTLVEAKVLVEHWRKQSNRVWLHSALTDRPPGPEVILPSPRS
jgi:hypothetical protein